MITTLLLLSLFLMELIFLVRTLQTHTFQAKAKLWGRLLFAFLLITGLLTGILKGTNRYGMLLVLLILQALLTFADLRLGKEHPFKIFKHLGRSAGSLLLYFFALLPAIFFPQYNEPPITGTYSVATSTYTWTDESRIDTYSNTGAKRFVTVKFWYPKESGTYPLVIFSHGSMGMIESNASTCMELASNGYIAVSIGHPYQSIMVEDTDGNTTYLSPEFGRQVMTDNGFDTREHNQAYYDMSAEWMDIRTGDMNFVLDTILAKHQLGENEPFAFINPDKIGLFGHSLGGATAVAVGRQRTDIDAVINLEATMLSEYTGFDYDTNCYSFCDEPYPVPLLDVNSAAVYEKACSITRQDYVNFHVGRLAPKFHSVIFHDAGHLNFTDLPLVSPPLAQMFGTGTVDAGECIRNMNEMILNYFDYYLKDMSEWKVKEEY